MPVNCVRRLPDGEKLVWMEGVEDGTDNAAPDPRTVAHERRRLALAEESRRQASQVTPVEE